MNALGGLFITFDGPNGVGKSSFVKSVSKELIEMGLDVVATKEPTASALGQFVRESENKYAGNVLGCLVAADRYFHLEHEILPELASGKIVLSDRYVESSLVLQRLDGLSIDFIWAINSQIRVPDLSVVLIGSPAILDGRLASRNEHSRFERTKSRADELDYYEEAVEFMLKRGFNVLQCENTSESLQIGVRRVVDAIMDIRK